LKLSKSLVRIARSFELKEWDVILIETTVRLPHAA
jgi:hypothetical protein